MLIYVLLSILILFLFYILSLKQQLRTIQRQLMVRQHTHQNQPLHLQLLHRQLIHSSLAAAPGKCTAGKLL